MSARRGGPLAGSGNTAARAAGGLAAWLALCAIGDPHAAGAATLYWKGHTWQVSSGGIAGVCLSDPNNTTVDAAGYLHLKISSANGAWSASELFTTDKLGFGTYQWQIDGPIDTFDKNVVLGLFPYGPAAGIGVDGTNEIDIEYARWGQANGPNADWTDYPASGKTIGELSYSFSLGGATISTSRFVWSSTSITDFLFGGLQPVDGMGGLLKTWTYMPQNPGVNIPQQPLPLGMNLWCFNAPPSDGRPVEVVIRDFTFTAAGTSTGTAGTQAGGSSGGNAGSSGGVGLAPGGSQPTGGRGGAGLGSSGGGRAGGGGSNGGCSCSVTAAADHGEPGWSWMLLAAVIARRRQRRQIDERLPAGRPSLPTAPSESVPPSRAPWGRRCSRDTFRGTRPRSG